jgi:hypothetical protein
VLVPITKPHQLKPEIINQTCHLLPKLFLEEVKLGAHVLCLQQLKIVFRSVLRNKADHSVFTCALINADIATE